jgi:hypothetical protein
MTTKQGPIGAPFGKLRAGSFGKLRAGSFDKLRAGFFGCTQCRL